MFFDRNDIYIALIDYQVNKFIKSQFQADKVHYKLQFNFNNFTIVQNFYISYSFKPKTFLNLQHG